MDHPGERGDGGRMSEHTGRFAVVTGASSGIGLALATRLAAAGAEVLLAARRPGGAAERIRAEVPDARVEERILDLASLESVAAFAGALDRPIHLLVNNA